MIKDGFLYLAALIFAAAVLVNLPKIFKGKKAQVFFNFAPPIVLIYLGLMLLCTMKRCVQISQEPDIICDAFHNAASL